MDFGKNMLKKYGWNEGDGLGKNNNGITKPLKANLKFDKAGLGEDKSKEFNNHWWERAFNDAAKNINVCKEGENVSINVKDKDSVEITTKTYSLKNLKKNPSQNGYNHFIKKSVLSGSRETHENSNDSDPEEPDFPKYKALTYEELYAACDGLTAHKGARHGLTLSGKLNRIEEQERELLAKFQQAEEYLSAENWTFAPFKKQRKHPALEDNLEAANSDELVQEASHTSDCHLKSKKRKKKNKKDTDKVSLAVDSAFESADGATLPKEKKKRKKETAEESTQTWISQRVIEKITKKQKCPKNEIHDHLQSKSKKKQKLKKFANKSTMI